MLKDEREKEIISRARQKNVADPARSRRHFDHIFEDFLSDVPLEGTRLLDLGPGQYDFAELAGARGATTEAIDNDPAVIELGDYKGIRAKLGNLKNLRAQDFGQRFDGVFCKFSINAFWLGRDEAAHVEYVRELDALLVPGGWAWIAPWNGASGKAQLSEADIQEVLTAQAKTFGSAGYVGFDLTEDLSKRYGVHGRTANRALFLKTLNAPHTLEECGSLC